MTITGIVAEFNPFHNGHCYLLSQAEGVKIVAMSGNFVQRGEPAVVDKWTRAEMALKCGADLVVELPFLVAVQSADYFAQGAVDILERLGVDNLAFGTEENLIINTFHRFMRIINRKWWITCKICQIICLIHRKRRKCGRHLLVSTSQVTRQIIF